jgi:hypothetical protein
MKRLIVVVVAALALLVPGSAAAKGPSEAKITGPGLSSALTIKGVGEGDPSTDLGVLVQDAGFFPEVFGQTPSPLMSAQPTQLGARYLVTYTMPGGATAGTLEQELYPYAADGPVTFMRPGQKFWDTQSTVGGWYRGTVRLKQMLIKAGLPKSAVSTRGRAAISRTKTIAIGTGAGLALAAVALAFYRRRR